MATLIIGATGGIGAAIARAWPGEALWLAGRDETKLHALAGELKATPLTADVGYESHVRTLFSALSLPLETIVYAAGAVGVEALAITSGDATRRVWNANYFGLIWTLKHGLPKLTAGGRLYVIGARPELVTTRGLSQYAASKAAAAQALDVARLERRDATFTLVLPPAVDTGLWSAIGKVPRGALSPDVVARAIVEDRAREPGGNELLIAAS